MTPQLKLPISTLSSASPMNADRTDNGQFQRSDESDQTVHTTIILNSTKPSLVSDGQFAHFGSMNTPLPLYSDGSSQEIHAGLPESSSSFDFSSQIVANNPVVPNSNIGKRRGHRYKHSSVNAQHQIFLEPPPRPPLALPASLPIPTFTEACSSRSKEQTRRVACCVCHVLVALYVYYSAAGSLALTALSHLIFFDAISATICVVVDVLGNFEVWKRSTIRHPFGLERAEVLAGFVMSIFLLFMGFDLISHNLKRTLEKLGTTPSVDLHSQKRISLGSVDSAAALSIIATLISAIGLKNHARIGRTMRYACISFLPSILSNPSHFLTLVSSTVMLFLPFFSTATYYWIDRIFCSFIAVSMFILGIHFAKTQGLILLMSYSGKGINEVIREIKEEPTVVCLEEAKFWQVHYALCIASLKLRVNGESTALTKLRERINLLITDRLGGGGGGSLKGGMKWEVTMQFISES